MSLKNKVVIVTGASSGIGAALTIEALKQGAHVTAVDINQAKLEAMARNSGRKPLLVIADVSIEDQAAVIIARTVEEFGKIDVLVNNAGIGSYLRIFDDPNPMDTYDRVMRTDVRAVVHLTKLAIPHLEKTRGNIVNVSSAGAIKPFPGAWAYCAAKAALSHFSRCMAVELAPKGIRVNVVNPGPVVTDFRVNLGLTAEEIQARDVLVKDLNLLKRSSQPIEIAEVIVFLASDKAVGITGSSFVSDNGMLVR